MPFLERGLEDDKINLSDEEFYQKYNRAKSGHVYQNPMEARAAKSIQHDMSEGFWGTAWSSFISSPIINSLRFMGASLGHRYDPSFNITYDMVQGYEQWLDVLYQAKNEDEFNSYKSIIDNINFHRQVVSDSHGFLGTSGWLVGGVVDPTFFASGGAVGVALKAVKGFTLFKKAKAFTGKFVADKFGKDFASTAGGMMMRGGIAGATTGAAIGAAYSGIEAISEPVTTDETLKRMALFSIFGAVPGLFIGAGNGRAAMAQRSKADKFVKEASIENPNSVVLTEEQFKNAYNNEELINAKAKSALGFENIKLSPDIRLVTSESNVAKSLATQCFDIPIQVVDAENKLITLPVSIEKQAKAIVSEKNCELHDSLSKSYTEYVKNKYGDTAVSKLKTFKELKLWAGGKDYQEFNEQVFNEFVNPGMSTNPIIRNIANELYETQSVPGADFAMQRDFLGIKENKINELKGNISELERAQNANYFERERLINDNKVSIPTKRINGSWKYSDVSIDAVESHIGNNKARIENFDQQSAILDKIYQEVNPNIKDSKNLRALTKELNKARSDFEKGTKANIKETFSQRDKILDQIESIDQAKDFEEKFVEDLLNDLNERKANAIKPGELQKLGTINSKIRLLEKELKEAKRPSPKKEQRLKILKLHKTWLELFKEEKAPTAAEWKTLGKHQQILRDLVQERKPLELKAEKVYEAGKKKAEKLESELVESLEKLIPEIDKLKKNPNAKLTEGQLREIKGKVGERLRVISKEKNKLIKENERYEGALNEKKLIFQELLDENEGGRMEINSELEATKSELNEWKNKKLTHKDIPELPGGERYIHRVYDHAKILKNSDGFVQSLKEGLWWEEVNVNHPEYKYLKEVPFEQLPKDQQELFDLIDKRLLEDATSIKDGMLYPEDKGYPKNPKALESMQKHRVLRFPTKIIQDWLVKDVEKSFRSYNQKVYTNSLLREKVGTQSFNDIEKAISEDFNQKIAEASTDKEKDRLLTQKNRTIESFRCSWCRLKGVGDYTFQDLTELGIAFNHMANIVNNLNVARLIGGTVIAAFSDLAQAGMTVGFGKLFGTTAKWFTSKEFRNSFKGAEDSWIRAFDYFKNTRQLGFYNELVDEGVLSAVDSFSGKLADAAVKMSCIDKWDSFWKFICGYVTQENVLKIGEKISKGEEVLAKDLDWLTTTGITKEQATKMFDQFTKHGRVLSDGTWESGVGFWEDANLKNVFKGGIRRMQDQAILTPSAGSVPALFDRPSLKTMLQFRRFTFSTYSKIMIPMLQKRDLTALSGLSMMVSIGIMKAYLRALKSGYEISMAEAIKTSVKEAEFCAMMCDAGGLLTNLVGLNEKQNQTHQEFLRSAMGTGYDFFFTAPTAIPGLFKLLTGMGGEMSASEIHYTRKMLPFQNNIWLFPLFDRFEKATIMSRGTERAKKDLERKERDKELGFRKIKL